MRIQNLIERYIRRYSLETSVSLDENIANVLLAIANDTPLTNNLNWNRFSNAGLTSKRSFLASLKTAIEDDQKEYQLLLKEQEETIKTKNRYLKSLFSSLELQDKNYDKVLRLIESMTLPIVATIDQEIKGISIGPETRGYLNTSYDYLTNGTVTADGTFFFENYEEETLQLELLLNVGGKPANSISLSFYEDDIVKAPKVIALAINSLRVPFNQLEDTLYYNPKYTSTISIIIEQPDVSIYNDSLRKVLGVTGIKLSLNEYASSHSIEISKQVHNFLSYTVVPKVEANSRQDTFIVEGYTTNNGKQYPLSTIIGDSQLSSIKGVVSVRRNDELLEGLSIDKSNRTIFETQGVSRIENSVSLLTNGSMASEPYLYETNLLVRSPSNTTQIGKGTGETNLAIALPVELGHEDLSALRVYVNGLEWSRVDDLEAGAVTNMLIWEWRNGKLLFGDGTNGASVPPMGAVTIRLEPEAVGIKKEVETSLYYLEPKYQFDPDVNTMDLTYVSDEVSSNKKVLGHTASIQKLDPNIIESSVAIRVTELDGTPLPSNYTEQDFINGRKELTADGHYSIDYTNGYFYSFLPIKSTERFTISYQYNKITDCGEALSYEEGRLRLKKLKSKSVTDYLFNSPYRVERTGRTYLDEINAVGDCEGFVLSNKGVLEGTIDTSNFFADDTLTSKEVPFVNGRWEIKGVSQVEETTSSFRGVGVKSFTIQNHGRLYDDGNFSFEAGVYFTSLIEGVPNALGEYKITEDGVVSFYYDEAAKTLKPFKYSYLIKTQIEENVNLYSVDYNNGILYTDVELVSTSSSASISYKAANYFLSYRIVNPLAVTAWSKNQYSFNGSELIRDSGKVKVMFEETNPEEIAEEYKYYSPFIRDILLCLS